MWLFLLKPVSPRIKCAAAIYQVKAKSMKRSADMTRPSIPAAQLEGLWAMALEAPDELARRFRAPKVLCRWGAQAAVSLRGRGS